MKTEALKELAKEADALLEKARNIDFSEDDDGLEALAVIASRCNEAAKISRIAYLVDMGSAS